MPHTIEENIESVRKRLKRVCNNVGRDPQDVQIALATKTVAPELILEAAECGLTIAAENRVQEGLRKWKKTGKSSSPLEWHFIGHLQSNKVNKVVRFASMIQSIDRMKIVRKLDKSLERAGKNMDVLIQVNVSGEDSKYGLPPAEVLPFVEEVSAYNRLKVKGLMTIGLFSDDQPRVRAGFRLLRELRDEISAARIEDVSMECLSMGMTNDFEIAIEEGATMIRVGRAVFGEREHPDSYYWPGIKEDHH